MAETVTPPTAGWYPPTSTAAPQSPRESLTARIAITAVAGGVSLALGLASNHSLLTGLNGYPWGLRAADVACGTIGYAALWWRRPGLARSPG